jgi:hypothetical protein
LDLHEEEKMISRKFDKFWQISRSLAIGAFIIGSTISTVKCHCYPFEEDRWDKSARDQENREAFDRVKEGSEKEKDFERAREYERDREPDYYNPRSYISGTQ